MRQRRCSRCGSLKDQSDYVMGKYRMNVVCSSCSKSFGALPPLRVIDNEQVNVDSRYVYTNTRLVPQDIVKGLISVFDQINGGYK